MRLIPAEAGLVLYAGKDYQVRIYGERCEGHVTEIRDTQGAWLRPLPLEPDQPGFDCHEDGRVFDTEPPRSLIQKALRERAPGRGVRALGRVLLLRAHGRAFVPASQRDQGVHPAGTDQPGCSDTTPVEIDYGDSRPETAECVFGGGGRFFSFGFWRAGAGQRWYATELRGEAH